jgi:signal transduction histidine kinase
MTIHTKPIILKICLLFFWVLCGSSASLLAQPKPGWDTIKTSEIRFFKSIKEKTGLYVDEQGSPEKEAINSLPELQTVGSNYTRRIPSSFVGKPVYLQFTIKNDLDTVSAVYFLPGMYFEDIDLFRYNSQTRQLEPEPEFPGVGIFDPNVVSKLVLQPGETATFVTKLAFIKTTINTITPTLSFGHFLPTLLTELQSERKINTVISFLVCGIMLMMIFYSLAEFYINRNRVFLYYSAYAILLGVMFFFKAYLFKTPTVSNYFFESYFDFILQAGGTLFYFMFLRKFTQSATEFPLLNKVLLIQQIVTISGMLLFTILHFFSDLFHIQNLVENIVKYAWSACTVFFIIFALVKRHHLLTYLAIGHCFLFAGGLLSLFLINSTYRFNPYLGSLVNDSLFWYEMGILFELMFFLVALSYKNRLDISARAREKERLLLEYEKSAIERKMAVLAAKQEERNRISADMHDELGSGVTAIRLMSELAKTKLKDHTLPELERISNSANDLISKMNTIIWTMKSSNDTVDNMIAYVRSYAAEFFDTTEIRCYVEHPEQLPAIEMSGEKRRNVFLCIKEPLNNALKHSKASEVRILFKIGPHLVVQIIDNGVGVKSINISEFSNGLTNMHKRMESIDGHFSIRNENGTIVTLSIPLQ